jgi:hypothetical protein
VLGHKWQRYGPISVAIQRRRFYCPERFPISGLRDPPEDERIGILRGLGLIHPVILWPLLANVLEADQERNSRLKDKAYTSHDRSGLQKVRPAECRQEVVERYSIGQVGDVD